MQACCIRESLTNQMLKQDKHLENTSLPKTQALGFTRKYILPWTHYLFSAFPVFPLILDCGGGQGKGHWFGGVGAFLSRNI